MSCKRILDNAEFLTVTIYDHSQPKIMQEYVTSFMSLQGRWFVLGMLMLLPSTCLDCSKIYRLELTAFLVIALNKVVKCWKSLVLVLWTTWLQSGVTFQSIWISKGVSAILVAGELSYYWSSYPQGALVLVFDRKLSFMRYSSFHGDL